MEFWLRRLGPNRPFSIRSSSERGSWDDPRARATRGRGLASLGLMARLGVPVGGRVRRLRAVEDPSAPILKEKVSKLGGSISIVSTRAVGIIPPTPYKVTGRCGLAGRTF